MRFAIIYRPKDAAPPEAMPEMLGGLGDWMQEHGALLSDVSFFIGGGGIGTVDTDDPTVLARMITDNPFSPYSEIEIKPLIDPAAAMAIMRESYS